MLHGEEQAKLRTEVRHLSAVSAGIGGTTWGWLARWGGGGYTIHNSGGGGGERGGERTTHKTKQGGGGGRSRIYTYIQI